MRVVAIPFDVDVVLLGELGQLLEDLLRRRSAASGPAAEELDHNHVRLAARNPRLEIVRKDRAPLSLAVAEPEADAVLVELDARLGDPDLAEAVGVAEGDEVLLEVAVELRLRERVSPVVLAAAECRDQRQSLGHEGVRGVLAGGTDRLGGALVVGGDVHQHRSERRQTAGDEQGTEQEQVGSSDSQQPNGDTS